MSPELRELARRLYAQHAPRMLVVIRARLRDGSTADAEDVLSSALLRMMEAFRWLQRNEANKTAKEAKNLEMRLALGCAKREAQNFLRELSKWERLMEKASPFLSSFGMHRDVDVLLDLERTLEGLSSEERELATHFCDGLTVADVARGGEEEGKVEEAERSQVRRERDKLRKALKYLKPKDR